MGNLAWGIEPPKGGQGIGLVPFRSPGPVQVPAGFVNIEGGVQGKIQLKQLLHDRIPMVRIGRGCLLPEFPGLLEAVLFVVVVVVVGVVLDDPRLKHGLGQTVPVLHGGQPPPGGIEHVCARHLQLRLEQGLLRRPIQPLALVLQRQDVLRRPR